MAVALSKRGGHSEFDVGDEELDVRNSPLLLIGPDARIVGYGHIVRDANDLNIQAELMAARYSFQSPNWSFNVVSGV